MTPTYQNPLKNLFNNLSPEERLQRHNRPNFAAPKLSCQSPESLNGLTEENRSLLVREGRISQSPHPIYRYKKQTAIDRIPTPFLVQTAGQIVQTAGLSDN